MGSNLYRCGNGALKELKTKTFSFKVNQDGNIVSGGENLDFVSDITKNLSKTHRIKPSVSFEHNIGVIAFDHSKWSNIDAWNLRISNNVIYIDCGDRYERGYAGTIDVTITIIGY